MGFKVKECTNISVRNFGVGGREEYTSWTCLRKKITLQSIPNPRILQERNHQQFWHLSNET